MAKIYCEFCGEPALEVTDPLRMVRQYHHMHNNVVRCAEHSATSILASSCRTRDPITGQKVQIYDGDAEPVQKFNYVNDRYGSEPGIYTLQEFEEACRESFGITPELIWQTDGIDEWYVDTLTDEVVLTTKAN